jgi:hypothetical protein
MIQVPQGLENVIRLSGQYPLEKGVFSLTSRIYYVRIYVVIRTNIFLE